MPPIQKTRLSREESRARTRALLLESARVVFAKQGYAGTSVDHIAEAAGYSKGAFYSNFAAKEDIFLELLDAHMQEEAEMLEGLLASARTVSEVPELLRGIGDMYRSFETDIDWGLLVLEFNLQAGRDPRFLDIYHQRFATHRAQMTKIVERLFAIAQARPPCSALELTITLIALSYGIPAQRSTIPSSVPKGLLGNMIEVVLASMIQAGSAPGGPAPRTPAKTAAARKR